VSKGKPVRRTTMRYRHGRDSGSRARAPDSRRRRVPANAPLPNNGMQYTQSQPWPFWRGS